MNDITIRFATTSDATVLLQLIHELAEYEKLMHEVVATPELLIQHVLSPSSVAAAILAELNGKVIGYAVYFPIYSTFAGVPHMYLEDIFVKPEHRGEGVGKKLIQRVAQIALERGYTRMDWLVLDWNTPAIEFYERLNAKPIHKGWTSYSVDGDSLQQLADQKSQQKFSLGMGPSS